MSDEPCFLDFEIDPNRDGDFLRYIHGRSAQILSKACDSIPLVASFGEKVASVVNDKELTSLQFLMQSAYMQGVMDVVGLIRGLDVVPQVLTAVKLAKGGQILGEMRNQRPPEDPQQN